MAKTANTFLNLTESMPHTVTQGLKTVFTLLLDLRGEIEVFARCCFSGGRRAKKLS
jgi:hypothetical protein